MMKQNKIIKKIKEIEALISNNVTDDTFTNMQSFKDLKAWALFEERVFNGIWAMKILDKRGHLRFLTRIPPGTAFGIHWHDCMETCMVLSGVLYDIVKKKKVGIDQKIVYGLLEKHQPCNPSKTEDCMLVVDFFE